ncbi:DUF5009 domain-containing protein [Foetidibacter luteolus]|uniref:DUF5009 domain-containing protein n=1 Tax=Foetidibacter luteolus TaxID=2608880 RepID=UPI00129A9FC6|nr:DUF5009 domain-containing protein [Foetidibacter luteolus]
MTNTKQRIASIDILRALTMLLMIFVNDLWSLKDIPAWLEHVEHGVDGMGLADAVFPAFLFIVGLSIPYAVSNRISKGDNKAQVVWHIVMRSIALLVMGLYLVNGEGINEAATGMRRVVWNVICCTCFVIIWNAYPKTVRAINVNVAKAVAIIVLLILAWVYRGGDDGNVTRFAPQWWGILGLIGWSYLLGALIYAFSNNKLYINIIAWLLLLLLSVLHHAHQLPESKLMHTIIGPLGQGGLTALVMGGVVTSQVFRGFVQRNQPVKLMVTLFVMAIVFMGAGFALRPIGGIAKLGATPSWVLICSAIAILVFIPVYAIADVQGKSRWFTLIKPAGTDTLLCYLLPYYAYAVVVLLGLHLPDALLTGGVGLLKSLAFALLMVVLTGLLSRMDVRLKL